MRLIRTKAAVAGVGLALSLAACGDAGSDDEGTRRRGRGGLRRQVRGRHPDGRARRRRQDHRRVKFDQPGLGFKDAAADIPTGFDVEIAKLLVADLGIDPETPTR